MRGDTNGVEGSDHTTETTPGERRLSIVTLQSMLRKVSQSPFHDQYTTLVSSPTDLSGSSAYESQSKQDDMLVVNHSAAAAIMTDNNQLHSGQNGLKTEGGDLLPSVTQTGEQDLLHQTPQNDTTVNLTKMNPFYAYYLESGSKNHNNEDKEMETLEEEHHFNTIFVPPPEFQSSTPDLLPETDPVQNGDKFSKPEGDLFQSFTYKPHKSSLAQSPLFANGHFHGDTLNSPDLFKTNSPQTQNLSSTTQSKDSVEDLFQAAEKEDLLLTTHAKEVNLFDKPLSNFVDPFASPLNKEDDLFQSSQPTVNPFYKFSTGEADLFKTSPTTNEELFHVKENNNIIPLPVREVRSSSKEIVDVFSSSSANTVDPFPSPIARDLFQDVSSLKDPFTPSIQYDPFQDVSDGTPDIFQPLPSKTNTRDMFERSPSDIAPKVTYTTPSINSPSEIKISTPEIFRATTPECLSDIQPQSSNLPREMFTPKGTKHGILQPTPFSLASNLSVSPSNSPAEMTHVSTFKRPPKPLPRTRPPRNPSTPAKPPAPAKPPTPAKPKTPVKPPILEKPPTPAKPPTPVKPPTLDKPPTPAKPPKPVGPEQIAPKTSPKPIFRPLPKPVIRRKSKLQENKPVSPENYVVFENILLIGQEKCVEDWPEDSPEIDPDFKPSGKLKLRRESLKARTDSDGGSGEDQDGSRNQSKKRDKKFKMPLLSRRGSKDKFPDDMKEAKTNKSLSLPRKLSKDYFSEMNIAAGENEDKGQNRMDDKKYPLKTKVNKLLRRASTASSMVEGKYMNGHLPHGSKDDETNKKGLSKKDSIRRFSEGTVLDHSTGEEEDAQHEEVDGHGLKTKKKMKIKFVPHRGFSISLEKTDVEPKGAHGYTPRKGSKDKSHDDSFGTRGSYTPHRKSKDNVFEDVEELKAHALQSNGKAAFMDEDEKHLKKTQHLSLNGDEDVYRMEDCKPKKPTKMKLLHAGLQSSKEDMLDETVPHTNKKSSFSREDDDEELDGMEDCKPKKPKHKGPAPLPRKYKTNHDTAGKTEPIGFSHHTPEQTTNDVFAEDEYTEKAFKSPDQMYDGEQDEDEIYKPKKHLKFKGFKKHKTKNKAAQPEFEDPPGATSSNYMSEAAKAEWLAAQKDERAMAGMEEEDEEGDTDSLMEWWYTVEKWDEVPSDDENIVIKEDESKSFTILADKVHNGLRLFNKVFMERAEVLWHSIITLHAIADDINDFHHKAKIAGITGGTTTAVGGVAAIAGLALAPFTLGASLVVTAVGVGVATAGGITSASAAISDNVNNMHDRKKVEAVLQEYEDHLLDIGKILNFINQGLYKLRGHPFLRSGTQHYSEEWAIRRAVQMISLVDSPVMRAVEVTDTATTAVQGLFKGIDKYFLKDTRELKKGCKKEMVSQVKEVANVLNDSIVELNSIREDLQEATGAI